MEKVVVTFRLREGVTAEQYGAWAYEVDQRTTLRQDACWRNEVYVTPDGEILEDIEVTSWDAWRAVLASDPMKPVYQQWVELVDESTVKELRGRRVV